MMSFSHQDIFLKSLNPQEKTLYQNLLTMGFNQDQVMASFQNVNSNNHNMEYLLDWILQNPNMKPKEIAPKSNLPFFVSKFQKSPIFSNDSLKIAFNELNINQKSLLADKSSDKNILEKPKIPNINLIAPVISNQIQGYQKLNDNSNDINLSSFFSLAENIPSNSLNQKEYISKLSKKIKEISTINCETMIDELHNILTQIKVEALSNPLAKKLITLFGQKNQNEANNLKNFQSNVFNFVASIFPKIKVGNSSHFEKLESILKLMIELKIPTHNQLNSLQNLYTNICYKNHFNNKSQEIFEKIDQSATKFSKILKDYNTNNTLHKSFSLPEPDDSRNNIISKTNITTVTATTKTTTLINNIVKTEKLEETKETTDTAILSSKYDKECCIICMARTRELVFLPCKHFLTCDICGEKFKECPVCSKKIDSLMKIYWC